MTTPRKIRVDGRSAEGRRYRELRAGIVADMGGERALSTSQNILIDNLCWLVIEREIVGAFQMGGGRVDPAAKRKLDSAIVRVCRLLGFDRSGSAKAGKASGDPVREHMASQHGVDVA